MTGSHSRPLDRSTAAPRSQGRDSIGRGQFAIWLPWLAAPVFLLLPVAGCGAAAALRQRALAAGGQIQAAAVQMQAAAVQVPAAAVEVQAGGLPVAPVATVTPVGPGTHTPPRG